MQPTPPPALPIFDSPASPTFPRRPQLNFSKGTLKPDEGQDLEAWRKVVGVKDAKDAEKKGPLGRLKEGATKLLLKVGRPFVGSFSLLGRRSRSSQDRKTTEGRQKGGCSRLLAALATVGHDVQNGLS